MQSSKVVRNLLIGLFLVAIIWQSGILSLHTIIKIKHHKAFVKSQMKAALKNGLHDEDLEIFTEADLKNAHWEHNKEFFLNRHKYDVVKKEKTKNGYLFYCILDSKEIALYKSLDKHNQQTDLLKELIKKFNFLPVNSGDLGLAFKQNRVNYHQIIASAYRFTYCKSHFRPPIDLTS